ncbi:MAG: tetratricopeptide repeat protein, partial [Candidatus Aenigmarchaeota archaeon]|nr:tetratricopeptide repeat protein [Candidatus Aenigmarchaeota archaeon]
FNAYLKQDKQELESLHRIAQDEKSSSSLLKLEWKKGQKPPRSEEDLIHLIVEKGLSAAKNTIEQEKTAYPGEVLIDESVLNWLGYHFLYWWGREEEAVEVFKLNVSLFPESANAHDSLGEAYLTRGQAELAIQSYEKSLELNPDNANAASVLKRLKKKK